MTQVSRSRKNYGIIHVLQIALLIAFLLLQTGCDWGSGITPAFSQMCETTGMACR